MLGALVRSALRSAADFLFEPIDARVYAAVRIAYAIMAFGIVVELWPIRHVLLGPNGMIVRPHWAPVYLPLYWITSDAGVTALMVVAGVCAACVGIGFLTRVSLLAIYLWAFSYGIFAFPAGSGYDGLVRLGAVALLVSPPARCFAVDATLLGRGPAQLPRYGLRLLQWQLAIVYAVTVWIKLPDPYWRNGEMMSFFWMSVFSRMATPAWAHWQRLSAIVTWGSLLLEATIPLLLFHPRGRRWGFAGGIALHGGIAVTSTIGLFSLCMTPFYAAFLEGEDFDAIERMVAAVREFVSRGGRFAHRRRLS